jgi:ABC-type transport system involved in Fe-S cluster assembly fused permease/ATPase subunit
VNWGSIVMTVVVDCLILIGVTKVDYATTFCLGIVNIVIIFLIFLVRIGKFVKVLFVDDYIRNQISNIHKDGTIVNIRSSA